jgi:hypothetical protein
MPKEPPLQSGFLSPDQAREFTGQKNRPLKDWLPFVHFGSEADWLCDVVPMPVSRPQVSFRVRAYHATLEIEHEGSTILIDPGQEFHLECEPKLILVTHAHADHSAGLAQCCNSFPKVPVIMTETTAAILGRYDADLTQIVKRQAMLIKPGDEVSLREITINAWSAGHLIGACMFDLMLSDECIRITGDFSLRPVGEVVGSIPGKPAAVLLMSSSHAWDVDNSYASANYLSLLLGEAVERAVAKTGTPLTLVGNTLGECQEIYCALVHAKMQGKLRNIQIGTGEEIMWIANLYKRCSTDRFSPWALPLRGALHYADEIAINSLSRGDEIAGSSILYPQRLSQVAGAGVYPVSTHASFGELITFALLSRAHTIALYHSQAPGISPLARLLQNCGRQVIALSTSPTYLG